MSLAVVSEGLAECGARAPGSRPSGPPGPGGSDGQEPQLRDSGAPGGVGPGVGKEPGLGALRPGGLPPLDSTGATTDHLNTLMTGQHFGVF